MDPFGYIYNQAKGCLAYFDGVSWRRIVKGTTKQVLAWNSSGVPAAATLDLTYLTVASQAQGDIIYFDGTNWVRLAAGTSGYLLKTQGAGANPAWQVNDNTALVDRTRRIAFDLSAGFLDSGTGAITENFGPRISFPDAETGGRTWSCIQPVDVVAGGGTLYWLWDTPATGSKNAQFNTLVWTDTAGATAGTSAILSDTSNYAINGTTNVLQLSSVALSGSLSAGSGRRRIQVRFIRNGAAAADTVNDVVYLREVWLEYTADS